jgi:hypothetical protein
MQNKRRIPALAFMLVAAMMLTAAPAVAKKGGGGDQPVFYDVTMSLDGTSPGIASTCAGSEPALTASQSGGRSGSVLHADGNNGTSPADLYYQGPGLVDGCYQGLRDGSPSGAQLFRVYMTNAGALDHIDWFFDVEAIATVNKRGKPTGGYTVTHKYWLQSLDDVSWSDGVVTGTFELWDYTRGDGWTLLATPYMTFGMDATCTEGC